MVNIITKNAESTDSTKDSWQAHLALEFQNRIDKTILAKQYHKGPMLVQRPFYPEGPVYHVYLIHPPGGVVGGDVIEVDVSCQQQSKALITTPAAGKFYRSGGKIARQRIHLSVSEGSELEWLPQETIVFNGAQVTTKTQVNLGRTARFIGWEFIALGRPACKEAFASGHATTHLEIFREDKPLLLERTILNREVINSLSGLQSHSLIATMVLYPAAKKELEAAREIANHHRWFGATLLGDLLVCRMLGYQAEPIRVLFATIWGAVRPLLMHREACPPRIWAT